MSKKDFSNSSVVKAYNSRNTVDNSKYSNSSVGKAYEDYKLKKQYSEEYGIDYSQKNKLTDKQTKIDNLISSNPNMSTDLEALRKEYEELVTKKTNLTTPSNTAVTGGESLMSYSQFNNSIRELDDAISKKNREIKTVEDSQKKTNMEVDAIGSDDYDYYTKIGSEVKNPTTSQARGLGNLKDPFKLFTEDGALHPFGKEVNNIVTYSRDNYDEIRMEGYGAVGDEKYHFMTDDEVGVYNYYLAKENEGLVDKGTAQSYLDSINEVLNQRVAENRYETQGFEDDIIKELAYGMVEAGPEQWRSGKIGFIKSLKGDDTGLDTTTTQYLSQMIRQDLADDGPEILGNSLGQAAYDFNTTTANMIPTILLSKWAGSIGSASGMSASATKIFSRGLGAVDMGTSAAGNSYQEMINEGYNVDQAKTYAYINGALEAGLEYAIGGIADIGGQLTGHQIEKLTKMVNNTALKVAIEYGGEMLSEGFEEGFQEALDPFVKAYATGEYADRGDDYAERILYSMLLGAISSLPFNAGSNAQLNADAKYTYGANQNELVAEGLESAEGTNSRIQAEKNQQKLDKGKNLSARELRYQVEENESAIVNEDISSIASATEERLTELGETGNVKELARIIAESVAGEEISRKDQKTLDSGKYTTRVLNELNADNVKSGQYTSAWAEKINTNRVNSDAYGINSEKAANTVTKKYNITEQDVKDKVSSSGKTQVVSEDGKTATDTEIKSIKSIDNGKMTLEMTDGSVVDSSKVLYANSNEAYLYEAVASAGYGVTSANAIVNGYSKTSNQSVSQYLLGVNEAYNYGYTNYPLSSVNGDTFITSLTDTQKQFAYDIGKYEAGLKTNESNSRVENSKTKNPLYKKGKVVLSRSVNATTERQKTSLQAIGRVVADITHNNVVIYESVVNSKGQRVFRLGEGETIMGRKNGDLAPNGIYDPNTGTIYIDINSGANGEGAMLWTFSHELTHYIREWSPKKFKVLADFLFEEYGNKGINAEELIQSQIDKASSKGRTISYDAAYEEVVADSMSNMLTDTDVLEKVQKLKMKDASLVEKIKSFISELLSKIKSAYSKLDPQTQEAKYVKNMKDSLEKLSDLFAEALVDAGENFDQIGIEYYSDMEAVAPTALSERTWSASEYVNQVDAVAEQIANELGVSKQTALKYIKDINSVAKSIADDRVRLDYEPNIDPNATTLKPNSEYKWSVDMSTLCAKRLLFTGTFDEIQKRLPNKVFNSEDIIALRKMMMDRGYQVACGPCYVESTRREIGEVTNQFIERYKLSQKNGKPITRVNSSGEVKILTEKDTQRTFVADKNYTPTMADLNTTDIDKVKVEHPDVYAAYLSFMNARGQQKPKLLETRAEYKGEILDVFKRKANGELSKATISRNNSGGLRLQSFSDFEVAHLIDMMQVVMDMSRVGLKSQAYTKVPEFAEAFGNTGIKINLSLIAKGSGVDKNGKLIFDDIEGIDSKRAFELRKKFSKNVGTILVGKNDAHIIAAMADSRIDYIIPFHKSQWKESLYEALGLTGYEDYTDYQNEKSINPDRKIKNFDPSEYWDFSKSGDENAQIYLKKCKEDGRIPKFPKFQNYPGYWKLLIDFKMYDNDGFGAEQQPVRPIFNNATNQKILKNYEGGHRSFKVAEDVVNDFVSQYQDGELLSDRAIEQGYTSADTSLDQVPALHKSSVVKWGETNLDIGGGKYDAATDYLKALGVTNYVFDPYNRDEGNNKKAFDVIQNSGADTVTCANVLNVIDSEEARANVILEAAKAIKEDGTAYFSVYEGNGTGVGKQTTKGWQNNRKTKDYIDEIKQYFDDVSTRGKVIVAKNPKANLPKATWEISKKNVVKYSDRDLTVTNRDRKNYALFKEEINKALSQNTPQNHIQVLQHTPKILQAIGLDDKRILMTLNHYKDITHTEGKNPKWHGLTPDEVYKAPIILSHPAMIVDSLSRNDSIIVISDLLDSKDRPIIIAIYTDGEGMYDYQMVDSNFLTSMYGRNGFENFMNNLISNDKVLYIDDKKSHNLYQQIGIQFPSTLTQLGFDNIIKQSNNIVKENVEQKYLRLAQNPTENRNRLQAMVEQAARDNGFDSPKIYHGSNAFGFTKIDVNNSDDKISFFATSNEKMASTYTYATTSKDISDATGESVEDVQKRTEEHIQDGVETFRHYIDRYFSEWYFGQTDNSGINNTIEYYYNKPESAVQEGLYDDLLEYVEEAYEMYGEDQQAEYEDFGEWQDSEQFEDIAAEIQKIIDGVVIANNIPTNGGYGGIYSLYANTDNLLVIDGNNHNWNSIPLPYQEELKYDSWTKKVGKWGGRSITTRSLSEYAKDNKYDGVLIKNISDNGNFGSGNYGDVYIFFNPQSQVKSADPITYDDDGNVIPLGERFNANNDDIRYSDRDIESHKPRKAIDQRNEGYMLSEAKFKQLYSQHVLDYSGGWAKKGLSVEKTIEDIKKNGFKGGSGAINLLPIINVTRWKGVGNYNELLRMEKEGKLEKGFADNYKKELGDEYGKPIFNNIVEKQYVARRGQYILLVPNNERTGDKVKQGFKPLDWEVVKVDYDYQPLYEAYKKAYEQTHNGEMLYSDRDGYLNPEYQEHADKAAEFFGTTSDPYEAGYMLRNGKYLNFRNTDNRLGWDEEEFEVYGTTQDDSGNDIFVQELAEHLDHGYIAEAYGDSYDSDYVDEFISEGNIRMIFSSEQGFFGHGKGGLEMSADIEPSPEQYKSIRSAVEDALENGYEVVVDYIGNKSKSYDRFDPKVKDWSASDVINNIKYFYANGKTRSNLNQFLYSERDENPTDSRSLLANALLTSAQNDTERKYIADYQKNIEKINTAQNRLAEVNAKIKELSFAEGPKDKEQIRLLKEEATKLANNISTYDKKLLRLESTKPIKNVLAREKTVAKDKAEERSKARLEAYKQKAIAKQEKLAETYAERQERAIARYKDRSANREQKLTDKYEARLERERQRRVNAVGKEEERIESLKESHKKYVERVKEREQKLKDEARYKKEIKAQNRNAQEIKSEIRKIADDLRKMLSNPTENRYVPYPLVNGVIDVCNAIDSTGRTYYKPGTHEIDIEKTRASYDESSKVAEKFANSRQALIELKLQYDKLENAPDYDFSSEFNEEFSSHIEELADAVGDTPIREMTDDQLSDVYDILSDIRNMIMSAKMQIGLEERITNYQAGQEIIDNMQTVKDLGLTTNQILTFFREWTENPMRATREMSGFEPNSRLVKLFEALDEGRRKADEFRMINSKTFDALRKSKADEKAFNDAVQKANLPVTDINDNTVMISHMQALQALLTWEREQANPNRNHLGTPVKFTDVELEAKGKYDEYAGHEVMVDVDFINTVMENLTEWDKKYLDAARTFFRVISRNAINEVSLVTKHRLIALEELYVPYYVNQDYIAKESENVKFDATIEGMGMLKSVKENAPQQLIIRGLNTILADHIDKVAKVYGLAIPVRNWNKAFNVVQTQKDGGKAVREAVGETWGKGGKDLLDQAVADLQSNRKGGNSKLLSTVKSGFVTSTLASNISVWMKQAASYPTAGAFLSAKSLAEAAPYFAKNLSAIHDEIDEHTSQHYIRRIGLSTQELGEINQTNGWQNKLNRKLGNWSPMNWIQAMDVKTTAVLWVACKNEIESRGISRSDENYWNEVTKLYDKVIEETQPMYDPLHRAEITKNDVYKNIIMFQTQPIQNSGILREGAMELKMAIKHYGKDSVQVKEASKKFRMAVGSQLASHFTFTLMTLLSAAALHKMNRYRDDDDELTPESVFAEFMKQFGENFFGALVPVFGSYMTSIVEKFVDGNRYDVVSDATVDKVNDTINNFVKLKNPTWEAFLNMASDIASYFGIPSGNLLNIINGARLHIEDAINGEFGSFEAGIERTSTQDVNRSYEAYVSGNTEKFNSIEVDQSSVTRVLRPQFLEAYSKNDTETMANIRRYMKATKLYKNDVVEVTQNWIKNSKK